MRIFLGLLSLAISSLPLSAEDGQKLYAAKCARCHGAEGQGTKKHPEPLVGKRSVSQLAEVIRKTMPESDPGTLTGAEAKAIADDIHGRFYSEIARARNKPARIELARLTVKQYRQAVADVIGSFRPSPPLGDKRGLKGEYFASRGFNGNKRVLERIDSQVAFDFGIEPPVKEKIEANEFSIRWNGSLIAPETGEYEFRSAPNMQPAVGQRRRDATDRRLGEVGQGYRIQGPLFLVAGRAYPLRLEYSKAKQGVNDTKKTDKPKPVPSSIALSVEAPRSHSRSDSRATIWSPSIAAESFACGTPFPPDDRSLGWERGTSISKEWDDATTDAALDDRRLRDAKLNELGRHPRTDGGFAKKLQEFATTFAERAFRRPLSPDQKKTLIEKPVSGRQRSDTAVKRVVLLVLMSPRLSLPRDRRRERTSTTWPPGCRSACGIRFPTTNC